MVDSYDIRSKPLKRTKRALNLIETIEIRIESDRTQSNKLDFFRVNRALLNFLIISLRSNCS